MLRSYQPDLTKRLAVCAQDSGLNDFLFESGMNPSGPDWLGVTPLHRLARKGELDMGASSSSMEPIWMRATTACGSTPLGWAAKHGGPDMAQRLLLDRGAEAKLARRPALGDASGLGDASRGARSWNC